MEKGIVAGALFLSSFLTPAPTPAPKTSQPPQPEMNIYVVKPGDSLTSIAASEYGDGAYWTNLWNDNPWIKDSSNIEKDWKLKVEVKKTDKPEELKEGLLKTQVANNSVVSSTTVTKNAPVQTNTTPTQTPSQVTPAAQATSFTPGSLTEAQINYLGSCESGMTAGRNSGNGYYGAFQFSIGTWNSMGTGYERADLAPLDVQINAVQRLVARSSVFGQFPGCSARMRAAGLL